MGADVFCTRQPFFISAITKKYPQIGFQPDLRMLRRDLYKHIQTGFLHDDRVKIRVEYDLRY